MANIRIKIPGGQIVPMKVPDDWSQEQIQEAIKKQFPTDQPQEGQSSIPSIPQSSSMEMGDILKGHLQKGAYSTLQAALQKALSGLPENFAKGASEGMARTGLKGASGLEQLARAPFEGLENQKPFSLPPQQPSQSWGETIGRGAGDIAGTLGVSAPVFIGAEEALPAAIPGLIKTGLSAFTAGAASKEGGEKERGKQGLIDSLLATSLGMLGKGAQKVLPAFKRTPDLEAKIKDLQTQENQIKDVLGNEFDSIATEAEARGINKIPVDKKVMEQIDKYTVKSKANKLLLEKAKQGDYESLRRLQSHLRERADKLKASQDVAQNDLGELMSDLREDINGAIEKELKAKGHDDLVDKLNATKSKYKAYKDKFFANKELSRIFGGEEELPSNLLNVLTKQKNSMKKFREMSPELDEMLKTILEKKEATEKLKKIGLTGAGLGSLYGLEQLGKSLYKAIED